MGNFHKIYVYMLDTMPLLYLMKTPLKLNTDAISHIGKKGWRLITYVTVEFNALVETSFDQKRITINELTYCDEKSVLPIFVILIVCVHSLPLLFPLLHHWKNELQVTSS
jgi:hypothetical protein